MRAASLLLSLFFFVSARASDVDEFVKVRLDKNLSEIQINGSGVRAGNLRGDDVLKWSRWSIRAEANGWTIRDAAGVISRQPAGPLAIRGTELRTARQEWPARLVLVPHGKTFDVVAEMDLREYLSGVVAHEMPPSWPEETLKAQAVAARSYALAVRRAREKSPWHLESTIDDQVFRVGDPAQTARARRAVTLTDGLVLKKSAKVLKAYYHADCGGRTVAASTVWPGEPDTGVAVDPWCPSSPAARWRFEIPLAEAARKLNAVLNMAPQLNLEKGGDRVASLSLGARTWDANRFRLAIGSQNVKSTRFKMKSENGNLIFEGNGFGHGAGLCQWGSRAMGLKGFAATAILSHYYPKAEMSRF